MKTRIRISALAIVAAALVTLFGASTASAIAWNPPCPNTTVVNNTPWVIGVCPWWVPGLVPPCTPFIPAGPGTFVVIPTGVPALQLNGMVSLAGNLYPLVAVPAFPPPPIPAPWYVPNIMIGPGPGNCVDIYADPATCTITVFPTRFLPPCRP